jgi:SpoIID/LytB domain protein
VAVTVAGSATDPAQHVQLCQADGARRGYRGALVALDGGGTLATVNEVRLDDYLRGVLPREMPPSWGSRANGVEALKAQAVAARSYALSGRWRTWATTCDTTSCQVYGGSSLVRGGVLTRLEDPRTDSAVLGTSGQVRRHGDGRVARTEFSASTGGRSAGGAFPSVADAGDATAGNPHRSWTVTMDVAEVGRRLGVSAVSRVEVTRRGDENTTGGRVAEVAVITAAGERRYTGDAFRAALGLKSTRFTVAGPAPSAETVAVVRALYVDILGRTADTGGLVAWSGHAERHGASAAAGAILGSEEAARRDLDAVYRSALGRPLGAEEGAWHLAALRAGTPRTAVAARVFASAEGSRVLGTEGPAGYVDSLYRAVLGRPADPQGSEHWTDVLAASGAGPVALGILSSDEAARRRLGEFYLTMLGRGVDPAGRATWAPLLRAGRDREVLARIAGSTEYQARAVARSGG